MTTSDIDFWFTAGSTYSYLTVMRLPEVARKTGLVFRWRPFHRRALASDVAFPKGSPKMAYMWRDIERRAAMYGIPARLPAPYPLPDNLFANQIALIGINEGWGINYVRASYRRWFQFGEPSGSDPNLSASLEEVGQDPTRVAAAATAENTKNALMAETEVARAAGLFGSPSFVVNGEMFWGDDRLDDAVAWAQKARRSDERDR
jgi:2-hydroxychromene-2-carboxylate isomerase